jgi:hypothetical protein
MLQLRVFRRCRAPGQSMTLPGLRRLLLFGLLGLLRLFRLLRFLSHSILSGFNGLKRDTRHARRRASLAKSSTLIPADSQAPAPCCHTAVTALSTDVMRFDALFAKIVATRHVVHCSFAGPRQVFRSLTDDDKRAFKPSSEPSASLQPPLAWTSRGLGGAKMWRILETRPAPIPFSSIQNHSGDSTEVLRVR